MPDYSALDAAKEAGEEVAWTIADALGELGGDGVSALITLARLYRDLSGMEDTFDLPPNPRFLQNGHGGHSPKTLKYMKSRALKGAGSSLLGAGSSLASSVTQVDVFGAGQAGNAMFSTSVHMIQLRAIAQRYSRSETITAWIDVMQRAKAWKMGVRTADFAGAVIPVGAVGITTGIATAITRAGVKLSMNAIVGRVAMEVHWRAKVENSLRGIGGGSGRGANGPASAIMYEMFTRRGATRLLGKYDIDALITEPGGYLALRDKMLLL